MFRRIFAIVLVFGFAFSCDKFDGNYTVVGELRDTIRPVSELSEEICAKAEWETFTKFECALHGAEINYTSTAVYAEKFAKDNGIFEKFEKEIACCKCLEDIHWMRKNTYDKHLRRMKYLQVDPNTCITQDFLRVNMGSTVGVQNSIERFDGEYVRRLQELFRLNELAVALVLVDYANELQKTEEVETLWEATMIYKSGTWPHAWKHAEALALRTYNRFVHSLTPRNNRLGILLYDDLGPLLKEDQKSLLAGIWLDHILRMYYRNITFDESQKALKVATWKGRSLETQQALATIYVTRYILEYTETNTPTVDAFVLQQVQQFDTDLNSLIYHLGEKKKMTPRMIAYFHTVFGKK